ncbi:hypothetical protein lacNasYZ03_11390 [Lactobacillus nasalidis]|uniref:HTH cro/C1-type domain-containing protein n=1 Tax=Lactobacillus nasalidis TaxID=2797258 RepID=A0ABQ3W772_9LACO|nr:helix-turn-helix transcriptional regulator [Lactobacillus nasalidis]GHV97863.1 hypothetical protein lacNasYZ01_10450 [Lactobacillus nasalidis]GHW00093.1 hypothetical protein lacNasYZ02_15220 [Lactobacillus nasalidis]GHW01452.1 hypothetical protein lacNasYZ03_11390 [Lactobacillus nasalidis]
MNRIKQLRAEKGFSLRDLANDFSIFLVQHGKKPITNVTISRWENEKNSPTAEMWGLLADYFGVSVDYLKDDCPVSVRFAKPVWYCCTTVTPMGAKRVRERRGLTLKQVSEATGIPLSTISQYENGRRKTKREVLEKLSNYYGVDPKILLFRGRQETR